MKILIPTADYPPIEGGISTVTVQVARELALAGHEVAVVAPYFPGQDESDVAEPVVVLRYRGYRLGWLRFFPMLLKCLPLLADADLVLGINIAFGGVIGLIANRVCHTHYVTFAYAYEFLKFPRWSPPAWLLRTAHAHARTVVAISRFTRDKLIAFGVTHDRIALILPGAPRSRPSSPGTIKEIRHKYVLDSGPIILAVGRFIARKGHRTLVQAMPRILERVPDAQLVLVGQGPRMPTVIQETYALGIREHVLFPGRLSDEDIAGLYQACTVFALPTGRDARGQVEGFGLVFAEAQSYGKPVVAGRSGGVEDAVLDGQTGLLVEPDQPEALADAILRILDDPELARRLGENGKQRVESELNWTRFTQRLIETVASPNSRQPEASAREERQ